MNRREFLIGAAAAPVAAAPASRPVICIFSKHMAKLSWDEVGREAGRIGFGGVDLTVRPKGHVVPENAERDLPRAVAAIRGHGLTVPMITTDLRSTADPAARPTLTAAGRLKIPYWKPGYWHYDLPYVEQGLAKAKADAAGLHALGAAQGVTMGLHNHSGNYIGASVWDIREILRELPEKNAGYYFDPGHATIEGGLGGWRISLALVAPRLKMVALKDFYWERRDGRWRERWCPMGEGMVNWPEVFKAFAAARFTGPLTLHVEYESPDELAAIAKDFEFIRAQVDVAYR